jgi:DNA-binding transcriptional MerR regulator
MVGRIAGGERPRRGAWHPGPVRRAASRRHWTTRCGSADTRVRRAGPRPRTTGRRASWTRGWRGHCSAAVGYTGPCDRVTTLEIPNRSLFRQPEVCEIAQVQPYVLRSWEAEFPDLGVARTAGGPRVYRRGDLERVLQIKHLLFVEGLTLAGARRRLAEQSPAVRADEAASLDELLGSDARERILRVKQGLRELSAMLSRAPGDAPSLFELAEPARPAKKAAARKKK